MLASKIYEGWNIINDSYFRSKLSQKINKKLSKEASDSLTEIKKYFSRKNNLNIIRNKMGFHYDNSIIEAGIHNLEEIEEKELKAFLTHSRGNSFYALSDVITFAGMRKVLITSNRDEFIDQLMDDIIINCGHLQEFGSECLLKIIEPYLSLITDKEDIEISTPPLYTEIKLPFFIETPESKFCQK